jgi:hypothetical protein
LLAQCGEIRADTAEADDTLFSSETARDLLLHFDHAKIALGLIVVKRHGKIMQESEQGYDKDSYKNGPFDREESKASVYHAPCIPSLPSSLSSCAFSGSTAT